MPATEFLVGPTTFRGNKSSENHVNVWSRPLRGKSFRSQSFCISVSFQLLLFVISSLTSISVLQFRRPVLWHVYERANMILALQQSSYLFKWTTNRLCIQDFPQKQNLELHYVDFFFLSARIATRPFLSLSLSVREMFPYTRIQLLQPFHSMAEGSEQPPLSRPYRYSTSTGEVRSSALPSLQEQKDPHPSKLGARVSLKANK